MKSGNVHFEGFTISSDSGAFAIGCCNSGFSVKYHVPWANTETASVLGFLQTKEWEDAEMLHKAIEQEPVAKAQKK